MKRNKDAPERRPRVKDEKERKRLKQYLYKLIQPGVNLRQDWFFISFSGATNLSGLFRKINNFCANAREPEASI